MASFPDTFSEETVIRVLATTTKYNLAMEADSASGGTATDQTGEGLPGRICQTERSESTMRSSVWQYTNGCM